MRCGATVAKKKPPDPPPLPSNFFKRQCPDCRHDLHLVRIVGEPQSNPAYLGTTVFCCYECHVIHITEPVMEQMSYLGAARFRRSLVQADYALLIQTYRDMLLYIESFNQFLVQASRQPTLPERAVHIISSTYVFLTHVRRQLEDQLPRND